MERESYQRRPSKSIMNQRERNAPESEAESTREITCPCTSRRSCQAVSKNHRSSGEGHNNPRKEGDGKTRESETNPGNERLHARGQQQKESPALEIHQGRVPGSASADARNRADRKAPKRLPEPKECQGSEIRILKLCRV